MIGQRRSTDGALKCAATKAVSATCATHRAMGLRARSRSRMERSSDDICSTAGGMIAEARGLIDSVSCATGAATDRRGNGGGEFQRRLRRGFLPAAFSSRRSISRYSSAASEAVRLPPARAQAPARDNVSDHGAAAQIKQQRDQENEQRWAGNRATLRCAGRARGSRPWPGAASRV